MPKIAGGTSNGRTTPKPAPKNAGNPADNVRVLIALPNKEAIRFRVAANDSIDLSALDLKKANFPWDVTIASTDSNGDGWVTPEEFATGMQSDPMSTIPFNHRMLVNQARAQWFGETSIAAMRVQAKKGTLPQVPMPAALPNPDKLSTQPRGAFVPLSLYMADQLARGSEYPVSATSLVFHFDATALMQKYSLHEVKAAASILTERNGGREFSLTRTTDGRYHFLCGALDAVTMDKNTTGFDNVFHTHPGTAALGYLTPSSGDIDVLRWDPDHKGCVVALGGVSKDYGFENGVQSSGPDTPLWK